MSQIFQGLRFTNSIASPYNKMKARFIVPKFYLEANLDIELPQSMWRDSIPYTIYWSKKSS